MEIHMVNIDGLNIVCEMLCLQPNSTYCLNIWATLRYQAMTSLEQITSVGYANQRTLVGYMGLQCNADCNPWTKAACARCNIFPTMLANLHTNTFKKLARNLWLLLDELTLEQMQWVCGSIALAPSRGEEFCNRSSKIWANNWPWMLVEFGCIAI